MFLGDGLFKWWDSTVKQFPGWKDIIGTSVANIYNKMCKATVNSFCCWCNSECTWRLFLRFQLKPVKKNDPNNPSKKIEVSLGEDGVKRWSSWKTRWDVRRKPSSLQRHQFLILITVSSWRYCEFFGKLDKQQKRTTEFFWTLVTLVTWVMFFEMYPCFLRCTPTRSFVWFPFNLGISDLSFTFVRY